MGRITIFSLTECPHCHRAKGALSSRSIPYTEINLSAHPQKRIDMLSLADRLTVPQVFFNEVHIGGADDTLTVLSDWDDDIQGRTPLEVYQDEIESKPDPMDDRLALPTEAPLPDIPAPPRPHMDREVKLPVREGPSVSDFAERTDSVFNVTRELMEILPSNVMPYMITTYKDCFRASEAISAIKAHYGLPNRAAALEFCLYLQKEHKIFHHVCNEHNFSDTFHLFFRLQPYHTPDVLNSFRVWTERVDSGNPLGVVKRCKKILGQVESSCTQTNGDVDYVAAKMDPKFMEFEEAVCELQHLDLGLMDDETKLAFCINVYNLMIKHAFIKLGVPNTNLSRNSFFNGVKYNLGGRLFSFSELENGILRSNAKAPYTLSKPFSRSDPRSKLICAQVDPRIHFALNCGAKSCPPVKNFTAEAINEELRVVAQAFCEQDTSVYIKEDSSELYLSMIFYWYRTDFAESTSGLPLKVISFLRGEKRASLERMLFDNRSINIKWLSYDWSTNAAKKKDFEPGCLLPNEKYKACWSKQ